LEYFTALFSDVFLPVMDGVTVAVKNTALWLNRKLGPTCVVTHRFPGHEDNEEFRVLRCRAVPIPQRPPYRLGIPRFDVTLHKDIRNMKLDLVHAHSPFSFGRMALRLSRRRHMPLVATFHTKYRDDFKTNVPFDSIVDWAIQWIVEFYQQADEVWVPNEKTGETLREYGYQGAYEIMPNGVDLDATHARESLRAEGQTSLGLTDDDFLFLFVGQHVWEKNLAFLLDSLGKLKNLGKSFHMAFVGEGYASEKMRGMAAKNGLTDRTHFVGVIRDRERLMAYYARADLFLFPSLYDNAPLAVKEAASFRVPAVLLEKANAAEHVRDGENGFLAVDAVDGYADKLAFLMENPRLVRKVGKKAQKTLFRSWEDIADEVMDRYKALIVRDR
jgi:1,2-diacylglycerol 3-alpha-glucosyltransferase